MISMRHWKHGTFFDEMSKYIKVKIKNTGKVTFGDITFGDILGPVLLILSVS